MVERKLDTITFQTGIHSFISIGIAFLLLITIFLLTSYRYFSESLISSNNSNLRTMMIFFEHNINHYQEALQAEAARPIFIKAVMDPSNSKYYLPDYLDNLNFHDLNGNFVLTTFDGVIIYDTAFGNPVEFEESKKLKIDLNVIDENTIIMLDESDVAFISQVKYNGVNEGYLFYITPFQEVFNSNSFLWDENPNSRSITIIKDDKIIIDGNIDDESITSVYDFKTLPLKVEIATPKQIIYKTIRELLYRLISISFISAFFLSLIIAMLISRRIVVPLLKLEKGIRKMGSGEWEQLDEFEKMPREIRFLSRSFNSMQKSLLSSMQDLKNTQSRMIQNEKMASIGLLAAGVAHEINNPVGFINTNLVSMAEYIEVFEIIFKHLDNLKIFMGEKNYPEIESTIEAIKEIESEEDLSFLRIDSPTLIAESIDGTRRIRDIVQRLSIYARPGTENKKDSDINLIIENALKLSSNELKYKCDIETKLTPMPEVLCCPDQLTQVFINLLVNAAQAIEDHGIIRIETSLSADKVRIEISDTGKGMQQSEISKIFDPFFTTKEVGRGTGLGLSISKGIVESHNGSIEVKSTPGTGTCFTIQIPAITNGEASE